MTVQRRIEVRGPDPLTGRYGWNVVDDARNEPLAHSYITYAHQRSAVKAATREIAMYKPGTAILVIVDE